MNFDDLPVGQHKTTGMSELPPEDQPAAAVPVSEKVGPLSERMLSKNSKTRFEAVADLLKLFTEASPADPVFLEYYPHFHKYVSDAHPGAQEKALEAFLVLLAKSPPPADKSLSDALSAVVEKGLSSSKSTVKAKAMECTMAIYELDKAPPVVSEILKTCLTTKTTPPKTVAGALQAATQLLSSFGDPAFPVKEYISLVGTQAGSTNAGVRTEALGYFREAYHWVKDAVMPVVESLKTAQKEELKKQFAEDKDKPAPVPTRKVKGAPAAPQPAKEEKKDAKKDDAYSSAVEVSVLKRFGENWCGQILGAKKWSEKRDKLEELIRTMSVEKIKNDNCNDLCQTLKKLLNDSNIVVVNLALKSIASLAKGLRGHLATYSKHIFEPVMQKCKDKKTAAEAQKCVENLVLSLKLDDMVDIIKEVLGDKSPIVRARLCTWLETTVLPRVTPALAKTMGDSFTPILIKLTDDAISEVRDCALGCLGAFKVLLGDAELEKTIGEMNSQKQEKIAKAAEQMGKICGKATTVSEAALGEEEKVVLVVPPEKPAEDCKAPAAKPVEVPQTESQGEAKEEEKKPEETKVEPAISAAAPAEIKGTELPPPPPPAKVDDEEPSAGERAAPVKKKPKLGSDKSPHQAKPRPKTAADGGKSKGAGMNEVVEEDVGEIVSAEEAAKLVTEAIPKTAIDQLALQEWKERLKGLQELHDWINKNQEKAGTMVDALAVWLKSQMKDFREGNQNLMKETLAILSTLANTFAVSKKFAHETVPTLIEKLNDLKSLDLSTNLILALADSATPTYVSTLAIKCALGAKGPNAIKGALALLGKMLEGYGAALLPLKLTVDYAKHCLGHANQQVRTAATKYLVLVYEYAGDPVKSWLSSDLKEATYKPIETEMEKVHPKPQKDAVETKRKLKGESEQDAAKKKSKDLSDSLVPRANVASQITSKLVASLSDPSMKHRQEAKDSIDRMLSTANHRIQPAGLHPLISALKARMGEPCKNLARAFVALVGNIALAMGPGFKQYSKIIIQPLMYNLADKQNSIRSETVVAMDRIAEAAGPELVLNNVAPLLEKDNPDMRSELLGWIMKNKEHLAKSEPMALVPSLVSSMQDRSKEIRGLAEQVVAEVMPHTGFTAFSNAIQDLKPVVKISLKAVLEKCRPKEEGQKTPNKVPEPAAPEEKKEAPAVVPPPPPVVAPQESTPMKIVAKTSEKTLVPPSPGGKPPLDSRSGSNSKASDRSASKQKPAKKRPIGLRQELVASRSTNNLGAENDMSRSEANKSTISVARGSHFKGPKFSKKAASPSKSQLSGDSANGGLSVETVVLTTLGNKEKRAETDKNTKWPVNEVREDYVEKLKKALRAVLHPNLFDYMFATQFKKNLAAIRTLTEGVNAEFPSMVDILDLLFKWVVMRTVDQSNTAINKAILEFLSSMFKKLTESGYQMMDFEAAAILPMLCERTGIANSGFRQQIKDLIKSACKIYNVPKLVSHLMSALDSKNQKTKLECLGILRELAASHGGKVFAVRDTKTFARFAQSTDSSLKTEAVEILADVYKFRGEALWASLGEVTEKTRELLKRRFAAPSATPRSKGSVHHFPTGAASKGRSPVKRDSTPNKDFSTAATNVIVEAEAHTEPVEAEEEKRKQPLLDSSALVQAEPTEERPSRKSEENVPVDEEIDTKQISGERPSTEPNNAESQFNATDTVKNMFESTQGNLLAKLPQSPSEEERRKIQESARKPAMSPASHNPGRQDGETVPIAKIEGLEQCLEILRTGDISRRVDALMALNEKATSQLDKEREELATSGNRLFDTFADVLREVFDKPPHDIPIRFAKYFMTVTNKICSSKPILRIVCEKSMQAFAEQLLTKLLYDGLEKLGENGEGEYMVKALNSNMLRILENCNPTRSFAVLIALFKANKSVPAMTGKIKTAKLPGLIVKCILKLTKVIDSLLPTLDVGQLLLCLHEYLVENPSTALPKSANDDIGTRIVKTIINELVKVRGEAIWEDYRVVESHPTSDSSIKRWISIILKSTHPGARTPTASASSKSLTPAIEVFQQAATVAVSAAGTKESPDELKEIFKGLNSQATFHEAIKSLSEYMARHPQMELGQYFISCSKGFREYVMASLQKYSAQPMEARLPIEEIASSRNLAGSPSCKKALTQTGGVTPTGTSSSSSAEYRAKMAILRQKFGMAGKEDRLTTPTYATQHAPAGTRSPDVMGKIGHYKALLGNSGKKQAQS